MIINCRSLSLYRNVDNLSYGKDAIWSPVTLLGISRAECITNPLILIAATPVGAILRTLGNSGSPGPYLNVFKAVW